MANMLSKKALKRTSVVVCIAAVVLGIYQRDHTLEYVDHMRQEAVEWLGNPHDGWLANSTLEISSLLKRMGTQVDINNFQLWLSGVFYSSFAFARDPNRVSLKLKEQGVRAKYPVVIIPGFVTSGLEMWRGLDCFKGVLQRQQ
jgi:hypothetical protein